jgi:hypothetical protein
LLHRLQAKFLRFFRPLFLTAEVTEAFRQNEQNRGKGFPR